MASCKKFLLGSVCLFVLTTLSGCGQQYNAQWKVYNPSLPGQWQVNHTQYMTDNTQEFSWMIYVGSKAKTPNYNDWTTQVQFTQLTQQQAKSELGVMWKLIPAGHFYFYALNFPGVMWNNGGEMDGVSTSVSNSSDESRLVKDVVYRKVSDAPILLSNVPVQLTSIITKQDRQSVNLVFKKASS